MFVKRVISLIVLLGCVCFGGCDSEPDVLLEGNHAGSLVPEPDPDLQYAAPGDDAEAMLLTAISLGLTDAELAYLSLLFSRAGLDFDLTQIPVDTDGDAIPNIVDDDIDGDGIPNDEDRDIDNDGELNGDDDDIDDDGVENDDDEDIDSDGLENADDPDADSDGLSDRWDLDDDSDGDADDEDEDDEDDEPSDRLEDLAEAVANRGYLTESEQNRVALELARRFDDANESAEIFRIIRDATLLNEGANRPVPANGIAGDVNAVDQIYKQLAGAIEDAKRGQFNPDGPIANNARLRRALDDFKVRAKAIVTTGELFGAVRLGEIGDGVVELGSELGKDRLDEFVAGIRGKVPVNRLGMGDTEKKELSLMVKGGSRIGGAFDDEEADRILDGIARLRTLVADDQDDPDEEEFDRLLDRLSEIKDEQSGINLDDAIEQIEEDEEEDP